MPAEIVNPARGVGAAPEEGAGLEMELDIMRLYTKLISDQTQGDRREQGKKGANINIFKDSDNEYIECRVPPTNNNTSAIGSANVRRPKHSH